MEFYALIEEWPGESMVFFRELPGCFTSAPTTEEAIKATPTAITTYLQWLKKNDIVLFEDPITTYSVIVKEVIAAPAANTGPTFEADRPAPSDQEIDNALNVAATARAELIELIDSVPPAQHNQQPASDQWSLQQHLQHIFEAETFYISRLQEQPAPEVPTPPMTAEEVSLKLFENAIDYELILHELTPEQRVRFLVHNGESWTAAKVLRRMTEHLREHMPWMKELAKQLQ